MTAGQTTRHSSHISGPAILLAAMLVATLVGGGLIVTAVAVQIGADVSVIDAATEPATFDDSLFRAEERSPLAPAPFDASHFRAEERQPLVAAPEGGLDEHSDRLGGK
jgi:hypothetical protein